MICICVERRGRRRVRGSSERSSDGLRKQIRRDAGASEHRPAGLSLRTKNADKRGVSSPFVRRQGVELRPASLLIYFAHLDALLWERDGRRASERNAKQKQNRSCNAFMRIRDDRYLSFAYSKQFPTFNLVSIPNKFSNIQNQIYQKMRIIAYFK